MEGQQVAAVAGGAFGEHGHGVARLQRLRHLVHHAQRIALALALDVQRAARAATSAPSSGQRRTSALETKRASARRVHRHDVEPRDVVGDQQRGARSGGCAADAAGAMPSTRSSWADHQPTRACALPRRRAREREAQHDRQRRAAPCSTARAAAATAARSARASGSRQAVVGDRAGHQRGAHAAGQLHAAVLEGERRVLALAAQRVGRAPSSAPPGRTRRRRRRRLRPAGRRWPPASRAPRRARAPARR